MKKCKFIKMHEKHFVQRPQTWFVGMGREQWFKKVAGIQTYVASPELWEQLKKEGEVKTLIEHLNGKWEIING